MTRFRQLTLDERYQIQNYLVQGFSLRKIAERLNRAASSISRELKRNTQSPCKYWAQLAEQCTVHRRRTAAKYRITDTWLIEQIKHYLTEYQWSSQQIAGYVEKVHKKRISHEWIYQISAQGQSPRWRAI
jgi:IS30 family transposase